MRVTKSLGGGGRKDLASLGAGDCFGEMALLDAVARSAGAYASGPAELLRLKRDDLKSWLSADPSLAIQFFAGGRPDSIAPLEADFRGTGLALRSLGFTDLSARPRPPC